MSIRKAAAITLEKNIQTSWHALQSNDPTIKHFSEADRIAVRQSYLTSMVKCGDLSLVKLLSSCLHQILIKDWPQHWKTFETEIIANLTQTVMDFNPELVYPLLCAYNALAKVRQYNNGDDREEICDANFIVMPILESLMDKLLSTGTHSESEISTILVKKVFNIVTKHTRVELEKYFRNIEKSDKWMEYSRIILSDFKNPIFAAKVEGMVNQNTYEKSAFWGEKKSVLNYLKKYTFRYGIPEDEAAEYKAFAQHWATKWGPHFSELVLKLISNKNEGYFVPLSVLGQCCGFLARIMKCKTVRVTLLPNIEKILFDFIFPLTFFNKDDEEIMEDNPVEYLRRNEAGFAGNDIKEAALEVVLRFCREKRDDGKMNIYTVLDFITNFLKSGKNPRSPDQEMNIITKEALFHMLDSCSFFILDHEELLPPVAELLKNHVSQELFNQHAFMKMRSCSVINNFFSTDLDIELLKNLSTGICACMGDKNLAVQVTAA